MQLVFFERLMRRHLCYELLFFTENLNHLDVFTLLRQNQFSIGKFHQCLLKKATHS